MRALLILILIHYSSLICAQQIDTLSNLTKGTELYAPQYTGTNQWGYILGQNSSYRQQFAEKYEIEGGATVTGLVTHLTGVFDNPDNYVEFNVYEVADNGLPGNRLGGKQVFYKDLDLSGQAFSVTLSTSISVMDSFFVTFNVLDYLHGGYDGDTLSLMMGEPDSRSAEDLSNFGRNAIQAHNHTKEDWKDFYTQNFTPIATHFALYPIIEIKESVVLNVEKSSEQIKLYPNPASERVYIQSSINDERITVFDFAGKIIFQKNIRTTVEEIDVSEWTAGGYIIQVLTKDQNTFYEKLIID